MNVAAVALVVFYLQRINSFKLPAPKNSYIKVDSIPLSNDLDSINASAEAYVVFDTNSRTVLAGKNANLRFSPASTAKVMSAIVALDYYKLDDYLSVPDSVYGVEGSKMRLVAGEQTSVRNLLYGMMLPSGNDAAYTLAFHYPGGVKGFVNSMNKKARELSLHNTYFLDPSGYEDGNYTTASELARLGAYAIGNKELSEIVQTRYIELFDKSFQHLYSLSNLNELLMYEEVIGIKTGFTNEAGGVLLTAVKKNDNIFVVSVLKSPNRFSDTKDLMKFISDRIDFATF